MTPVGRLQVTTQDDAIVSVSWASPGPGSLPGITDEPLLQDACDQLQAYFEGDLTQFNLPLAPEGSAFRQRVWTMMAQIPFGQTLTYGAMARSLGTAARAVGGACGANPVPIIIPCHRVIASAGPGGYSGGDATLGGLPTKHWLLAHEGVTLA